MRLERLVWSWWRGEGGLPGALFRLGTLPLELLFRLGVFLRNRAYDLGILKSRGVPVTVVSVGNLAVGGTGKTPVTAWLAGELRSSGVPCAVLSRGYGEDELALHRRWNPDVPVVVARRRTEGATRSSVEGARVVLADDAFQHRALERDVNVVLLAAEHPLPTRMLPRGPYRESLRALRRATHVIVTRKSADQGRVDALERAVRRVAPGVPVAVLELIPGGWKALDGTSVAKPEGAILAVASIAGPGSFGAILRREGLNPELRSFPDHHSYRAEDVQAIADRAGGRTVVTTEKDAVKLVEFQELLPDTRVLCLEVAPSTEARGLVQDVLDLAGSS